MSYKYIPQINNQSFVYPNAYLAEYDVDILHDINENSVSGTCTNFINTVHSSTGLTFTYDYTWSLNNAEPFINPNNVLEQLSVHMLGAGQTYYKPFRLVQAIGTATTNQTYRSGSTTFSVTPGSLGLTTFVSGDYYFEIRFIGGRAIYPICKTLTITI